MAQFIENCLKILRDQKWGEKKNLGSRVTKVWNFDHLQMYILNVFLMASDVGLFIWDFFF